MASSTWSETASAKGVFPMVPLATPDVLFVFLSTFQDCFTRPSFFYFVRFITTFMISPIRKVTTNVIRQTPGDSRYFSNYHWFLTNARWSVRQVGQVLLDLLVRVLPLERDDQGRFRLYVALDETFVNKVGKKIAGVAWFFNTHGGACRGTHQLGNQWLVIGLLATVLGQTLCLPVRAALYRRPKDCPEGEYRCAREIFWAMIDALKWPQGAILTLIGDRAFGSKYMLKYCRERGYHLITRIQINSRVHRPYTPPRRKTKGRPRKYGNRVDLRQIAADGRRLPGRIRVYKHGIQARYRSFVGILRRSGDTVRLVVLAIPKRDPMVLICTDLSLDAKRIVKLYTDRFQIEMTFRDLKQEHGFGQYQARSQTAIERHAQLSVVACSVLRMLTLTQQRWLPNTALRDIIVGPWNGEPERLSPNQVRHIIYGLCILQLLFCVTQNYGLNAKKSELANAIKHAGLQNVRN